MSHFFISYKREYRDFVEELDKKLVENDLLAWYDTGIKAGEEWRKKIDLEINTCYAMVLVVTPESLASPYVAYEWAYAMGAKKEVIPIVLRDFDKNNLHPKLEPLHYYRVDGRNFWEKLIQLLTDIKSKYEVAEVPIPILNIARSLDETNPDLRKQAVKMLETYDSGSPNPFVIEALAEAVNHGYLDVRWRAAVALAQRTNYSDKRPLPTLLESLIISNKTTSEAIVTQLNIRGGVSGITLAQKKNDVDYREVTRAIWEIRDDESIKILWSIFENSEEKYSITDRIQAVQLLVHLGNEKTLVDLRERYAKMGNMLTPTLKQLKEAMKSTIDQLESKFSAET